MSCILITGATGSIGSALATIYATEGNTLILQGRKPERLKEVAEICEAKGARVFVQVLDLRDRNALFAWLETLLAEETLDMVILNAGVNTHIGPNGEAESFSEVGALVETNVLAVMAIVSAILPQMRERKKGQIVLISSLAGWFGLSVTPSYCASKAAVKVYGEGLRGWLEPEGIWVNVVMPGYVDSGMCRAMPGPKPFVWSANKAACFIKKRLSRNCPRITFPFPLNLGTRFLAILPVSFSIRILRWLGYFG